MNFNRTLKSLKEANSFLYNFTNGQLKLNKSKDYFYFTSDKGKLPESFMTKSIKNIWFSNLIDAARFFNEEN